MIVGNVKAMIEKRKNHCYVNNNRICRDDISSAIMSTNPSYFLLRMIMTNSLSMPAG